MPSHYFCVGAFAATVPPIPAPMSLIMVLYRLLPYYFRIKYPTLHQYYCPTLQVKYPLLSIVPRLFEYYYLYLEVPIIPEIVLA